MSEAPRRMIEIGVLPRASEIFADGADPLSVMIADAERRLDQERAAEAKAKARQAADTERLANTRRARGRRRFTRALKTMFWRP